MVLRPASFTLFPYTTLFRSAGDDRVAELADAVLARDARKAIELIGAFAGRGLQLGEVLDQLIDYWRGLMLALAAGRTEEHTSELQPRRELVSRLQLEKNTAY